MVVGGWGHVDGLIVFSSCCFDTPHSVYITNTDSKGYLVLLMSYKTTTKQLTSSLSRAICAATLGAIEKTVAILTGLLVAGLCPGLELVLRKSEDGRSITLTDDSPLSPAGILGSSASGDLFCENTL